MPAVNHIRAVGMVDVLQRDDLQPAALRLGKLKVDFLFVADRRLDFFHALDLLELALRLGGLGVLGPEPLHEFHHVRDLALLVFVGRPTAASAASRCAR